MKQYIYDRRMFRREYVIEHTQDIDNNRGLQVEYTMKGMNK